MMSSTYFKACVCLLLFTGVLVSGGFFGFKLFKKLERDAPDYFEAAVRAYEKQDELVPPEEGAIVFIGSSSIRAWKSLEEDMSPLLVLNRGFGGAQMQHVIHNVDRLALVNKPRGIVLYAGENDLLAGDSTRELLAEFERFIGLVSGFDPELKIWIMAIKPSERLWSKWDLIKRLNQKLEELAAKTENLAFIDTATVLLDDTGRPGLYYQQDGLHLNRAGYRKWRAALRSALIFTD